VFWVVDNGTSHRGEPCQERLALKWPNLTVVHTPIHASWLNQVEIYFSIVQRKAVTPNHFNSLSALKDRLLDFQAHYQASAKPFQWKFTRQDLHSLIKKLGTRGRAA
jgi:hypothetical protein